MQVRPDLAQLEGDHCLPGVLAAPQPTMLGSGFADFGCFPDGGFHKYGYPKMDVLNWKIPNLGPLVVFMGQVKSDRTWAQQRATNASSSEQFFSGLLPNNLEVS